MTFIDTNFFLRFFLKDIRKQYLEAKVVFQRGARGEEDLITSIIVVFEVFWVLNSAYHYSQSQLSKIIEMILQMKFIYIDERSVLEEALRLYDSTNLSLGDCYNLAFAQHQEVSGFKTFDVKLNKQFEKLVGKKKS